MSAKKDKASGETLGSLRKKEAQRLRARGEFGADVNAARTLLCDEYAPRLGTFSGADVIRVAEAIQRERLSYRRAAELRELVAAWIEATTPPVDARSLGVYNEHPDGDCGDATCATCWRDRARKAADRDREPMN